MSIDVETFPDRIGLLKQKGRIHHPPFSFFSVTSVFFAQCSLCYGSLFGSYLTFSATAFACRNSSK